MKNEIQWLKQVIDKAKDPIFVVTKVNNCDEKSQPELIFEQKVRELGLPYEVHYLCYSYDTMIFPEPAPGRVYLFEPKNQSPIVGGDIRYFSQDLQNILNKVFKADGSKFINAPELTQEQKAIIDAVENEDLSKFPSAFQQARNLVKQSWISGMGLITGRGLLATPEEAKRRLDICETCPNYREGRCILCGCFMKNKAHLQLADCGANNW